MFGFDVLPEILTVAGIAQKYGAEAVNVPKGSRHLTLAALRGAGIVCLKAVLTPANRDWTPGRLYRELERERRAMEGRGQ